MLIGWKEIIFCWKTISRSSSSFDGTRLLVCSPISQSRSPFGWSSCSCWRSASCRRWTCLWLRKRDSRTRRGSSLTSCALSWCRCPSVSKLRCSSLRTTACCPLFLLLSAPKSPWPRGGKRSRRALANTSALFGYRIWFQQTSHKPILRSTHRAAKLGLKSSFPHFSSARLRLGWSGL